MTTNRTLAARLTAQELMAALGDGTVALRLSIYDRYFLIADAATAKALQVEDARRQALVMALEYIALMPCATKILGEELRQPCACFSCTAQAALKLEEESS